MPTLNKEKISTREQFEQYHREGRRIFSNCDLSGLNLSHLDLSDCNFSWCDIKNTQFEHSTLIDVSFAHTGFPLNLTFKGAILDTNNVDIILEIKRFDLLAQADLTHVFFHVLSKTAEEELKKAPLHTAQLTDNQLEWLVRHNHTKNIQGRKIERLDLRGFACDKFDFTASTIQTLMIDGGTKFFDCAFHLLQIKKIVFDFRTLNNELISLPFSITDSKLTLHENPMRSFSLMRNCMNNPMFLNWYQRQNSDEINFIRHTLYHLLLLHFRNQPTVTRHEVRILLDAGRRYALINEGATEISPAVPQKNLSGLNFTDQNLADLKELLAGYIFQNCIFVRTNLCGTQLTDAVLDGATIKNCAVDEKTSFARAITTNARWDQFEQVKIDCLHHVIEFLNPSIQKGSAITLFRNITADKGALHNDKTRATQLLEAIKSAESLDALNTAIHSVQSTQNSTPTYIECWAKCNSLVASHRPSETSNSSIPQ